MWTPGQPTGSVCAMARTSVVRLHLVTNDRGSEMEEWVFSRRRQSIINHRHRSASTAGLWEKREGQRLLRSQATGDGILAGEWRLCCTSVCVCECVLFQCKHILIYIKTREKQGTCKRKGDSSDWAKFFHWSMIYFWCLCACCSGFQKRRRQWLATM